MKLIKWIKWQYYRIRYRKLRKKIINRLTLIMDGIQKITEATSFKNKYPEGGIIVDVNYGNETIIELDPEKHKNIIKHFKHKMDKTFDKLEQQ